MSLSLGLVILSLSFLSAPEAAVAATVTTNKTPNIPPIRTRVLPLLEAVVVVVVVVVDSATEDSAAVGLVVVVINRDIDNDGDGNCSVDVLCETGDIMGVDKSVGLGAISIVVLVDLDNVVPRHRRPTTSRRTPRPAAAAAADDTSS